MGISINNTKLLKGEFYFAAVNGRINFGYYVGSVPGFYIFKDCYFSCTHSDLSAGLSEKSFQNAFFLHIPSRVLRAGDIYSKEDSVMKYLEEVLPE